MDIQQLALSSVFLPIYNEDAPTCAWLGHIPFAGWIIEAQRPGTFVELGTHYGDSYFAFCQAVKKNGLQTQCYAVDTWQGDEHAGEYGEEVYAHVQRYHDADFADFSHLMRMRFDQALEHFSEGSVDLLHIDGLHTYEAVKEDFETWLPKLSSRAVVLFHDTEVRADDFGVWKYWDEVSPRYPHIRFSHSHGLGVLFVGQEQPPAIQALIAAWKEEDGARSIRDFFANLGQKMAVSWHERNMVRLKQAIGTQAHTIKLLEEDNVRVRERMHLAESQLLEEKVYVRMQLESAEEQVKEAQAKVEQAEARVAEILGSTSWRVTKPLRTLGNMLKG